MKSKMTKLISFTVACVMTLGVLAGCGGTTSPATKTEAEKTQTAQATAAATTQEPAKAITAKIVMPGDMSKRLSEFTTNEYAEKVKKDINVQLEFTYIPWGQYWDKIKLMLSSSQPFDMFWDGIGGVQSYVAKKEVYDITELLNTYGSNLKKMIPAKNYEATTIEGKTYAIPSSYGPAADKFNSIMVRQDILEKVGMKEIKTIADLEGYAEKAKAQFPDMNVATFFPYDLPAELMRELMDKTYTALTDMLFIEEGTSDVKVYDMDEMGLLKKVNDITKKWKKNGWIPEEAFIKYQDGIGRMDSGKYLMTEGAISRPMESALNLKKNVPDGVYAEYLLSPDKPRYIRIPGNEALMIPSYSKSAEGVVKWLDWIYQSQENYDFTVLGVEGKDYKLENGKIETLHNDTLFYEWMFRNINYMKFPSYVSDAFAESFKNWDNGASYSKTFGFVLNGESIKAEVAKIETVNKETLYPIILGYADYDKYIGKLKAGWKAAGMEKIKAEYQKQLSEYLAK